MRHLLSVLVLLAGAVAFAAGWAGPLALAVLTMSVLLPYLILLGGVRLRLPLPVATLAGLLPLAVFAAIATLDGDPLGLLRDAVPRLLTAPRPAPATPELLLPGVFVGGMTGTWAGVRAARPAAGRFAPVACAALLYVAGALLTAGQSDRYGVLAAVIVVCAVAGWSAGASSLLLVAAAAAIVVLSATMVPAADPFEPRRYVAPPSLPLLERNPLPRLAALAEKGNVELLRYTGPQIPLRLITLTDFDGTSWYATPGYRPVGAITARSGLPPGPVRSTITADITIAALDGLWLPSPGQPEAVSLPQAIVDAETGSLALPRGLSEGLRYQVRGVVDTAGGRLTVAAVPAGTRYSELPRLPFLFAEYAQTIVRGASTPFEQAVLIETAVRQDRRLNNRAPAGSSYARLETFLFGQLGDSGAQEGNAEQFATAFAVLARAAGLPTRVVAGFRPGDQAADGTWTIQGRHASAWPEVYFSGEGWVAFDPTPAQSDDVGPGESLRRQAMDRVQQNPPPPGQAVPALAPRPSSLATSAPPAAATSRFSGSVPRTMGVILLGLFAALVLSRVLRRLRHRRAGTRGAWSEVLDLLVLLNRSPARWHTADRIAADVASAIPAPAPHPIYRLAEAADRAAFAPAAVTQIAVAQVWLDLRRLRRVARRAVPWPRGLLWWVDPRPLLRR